MENMPAISTPDARMCSLDDSIHPQRPAWTPHNPDQTPTSVINCENQHYATSPCGLLPAYENVASLRFEETTPSPTYSAALFDALGERIARLREQLNSPVEDLILYLREDVEPLPVYSRYPTQSLEEERRARLRRLIGEQLGLTSMSQGNSPPHPPRPRRDSMALPRPQIELPSALQTTPMAQAQTRPNHHSTKSIIIMAEPVM